MARLHQHTQRRLGMIAALFVFVTLVLVLRDDQVGNRDHAGKSTTKPKFQGTHRNNKQYQCPYNESDANNNNNLTVPVLRLHDFATLLHLGKGGGGTIRIQRMDKLWRLKIPQCHYAPCNDQVVEKTSSGNNNHSQLYAFLVNVRDPVDRLVSAFYWPIVQFCNPDGTDTRIPVSMGGSDRLHTHCMKHSPRHLWYDLFRRHYYEYGHDVNQFAAALCDATNATKRQRAVDCLRANLHARHNLTDWFGFMMDNSFHAAAAIYPIVLDNTVADLLVQTDEAMEWLRNYTHFENDEAFARRRTRAQHEAYCQQQTLHATTTRTTNDTKSYVHSSMSSPSYTIRPTAESQRCLVRLFRPEYQLLQKIQKRLCKSMDCHEGIQAILDRRKPFLRR